MQRSMFRWKMNKEMVVAIQKICVLQIPIRLNFNSFQNRFSWGELQVALKSTFLAFVPSQNVYFRHWVREYVRTTWLLYYYKHQFQKFHINKITDTTHVFSIYLFLFMTTCYTCLYNANEFKTLRFWLICLSDQVNRKSKYWPRIEAYIIASIILLPLFKDLAQFI